METYSHELTAELASRVDLEVRALPGRPDGRPPGALAVSRFFITTASWLWHHRREYDVVHFGDMVLFPLGWLHSLWAPDVIRVITVHGLDLIYGNRSGLIPAIYRRYISWARSRSSAIDHYIANSRNTARLALELGFAPATSVPLGVKIPPTEVPSGLLPANERYLLFVGRIVPRKGAAWFAQKVLPLLPEDITLHVVGKAWDKNEEKQLKQIRRVKLMGHLSDKELGEERAGATAMIMPNIPSDDCTDVEGFGLVALEAPRYGIPLLASDIEGISDAVQHETTGSLLKTRDAPGWAAKLEEILAWTDAERREFARNAFIALREHYSWNRVARDTLAVYKKASSEGVKS
jgi:glycosyltransferase involved in cell wall biosynthesis